MSILDFFRRKQQPQEQIYVYERSHPAQSDEAAMWAYAPTPELYGAMVHYVLNQWVYTAVNFLAERAASAHLEVVQREDATIDFPNHPLLDLLGEYGVPNDDQDSFEFFEGHFTNMFIAGNSFWYWYSRNGGQPEEVHLLDPARVRIVPGTTRTVEQFIWSEHGREIPLDPVEVTRFKKYNPFNRYYGLSALHALELEVRSERAMVKWNHEFFEDDMAMPSGVVVLPSGTSEADRQRVEKLLLQKYGKGQRKTAVIVGDADRSQQTYYVETGLRPRDIDFQNGRILSRKAVYEAVGLPPGLMSEASTEAHAVVAERRLMEVLDLMHMRTATKINSDAMQFWARHRKWRARFEDISHRHVDWKRESLKLNTLGKYLTTDEVRTDYLGKRPLSAGEEVAGGTKQSKTQNNRQPAGAQQDSSSAVESGA